MPFIPPACISCGAGMTAKEANNNRIRCDVCDEKIHGPKVDGAAVLAQLVRMAFDQRKAKETPK